MKEFLAKVKYFIKSIDFFMLFVCIACSGISILALYSFWKTGQIRGKVLLTQVIAVGIGLIVCLIISSLRYEIMAQFWKIHNPIAMILVLLTFTPLGQSATKLADDKAWLNLGFISIQPSEILKLSFILTFALHLSKLGENINHLRPFLLLCLHGAIPTMLIMLQGDFGSALVFLVIFSVMMFAAGLSVKWIMVGFIGAVIAAPVVWFYVLPGYLRERFFVAWHPENYLTGTGKGWQQYRGRLAFGSGGLFGRGIASEDLYNKVPEVHNDFIFSYIGQILGLAGAVITLLLILFLCVKILITAKMSRDNLGLLICVGVFSMFMFQSIINIGMVLCIIPVIGITLPFFSAGGTSVVASYTAIGLVMSVYRQNKKDLMFD